MVKTPQILPIYHIGVIEEDKKSYVYAKLYN